MRTLADCRIPEILPLIAVPRLLSKHCNPDFRSSTHSASSKIHLSQLHYGSGDDTESQEIERLTTLSILDFPPELIASSIVDLWKDLDNEKSRQNFLRYQRGWVGHIVLLGCFNSTATKAIERVIEVACCLDLLCQAHHIAVTVIQSLRSNAVSRITSWQHVHPPLIHKMKEILDGSLAADVHQATVFHAPRDASREYWILSRPYVDDEDLLTESLAVEPQSNQVNDVESRITQLEALLVTISLEATELHNFPDTEISSENESESEFSDASQLTDTDTDSCALSSSDLEFTDHDDHDYVLDVAQQTRARISQRLESLKNSVHHKIKTQQQVSFDVSQFSIPSPKIASRSIDLLDQRAIFRARAHNEQISVQRRLRPSATRYHTVGLSHEGASPPSFE